MGWEQYHTSSLVCVASADHCAKDLATQSYLECYSLTLTLPLQRNAVSDHDARLIRAALTASVLTSFIPNLYLTAVEEGEKNNFHPAGRYTSTSSALEVSILFQRLPYSSG